MDKNAPIGIFDSGVGGLTVAREIMRQMPEERIVYFGDTARVPYGSKSRETIIKYSRQIVRFLLTKQVKAVVIACNTASAYAMDAVEEVCKLPTIGVVKPGARVAAEATQNQRIGVIGTEGTISSGLYPALIHQFDPQIEVIGKACPLFVPLVEEGWLHDPLTEEVVKRYLDSMKQEKVDTLVLGCTHYPLLRSMIRKVMGEGVNLVNPAYETAVGLRRMLEFRDMTNEGRLEEGVDKYQFYVSDSPERFQAFADSILPCTAEHTEVVNIEEY